MGLATVETFKKLNTNSEQYVHIEGDTLRKFQLVILNIAEDMIAVCEKENIRYCLVGGSALGAVRHGGFIPWDDDMDLAMPAEDFDRFIEAFSRQHSDKYWVHTCRTPEYGMVIGRVRLKGSVCRGREDIGSEECGIFVDIFRMENTYNNGLARKLHGVLCMGIGLLLSCRNFYKNRALMRELSSENAEVRRTFEFKINLGRLLSFCSVRRWAIMTQGVYGMCKNGNSRYVSIPSGRKHYFKEMYLRSGVVETVPFEFEGHKWNIPRDYKGYLETLYGDYMWIPPVEDREAHVVLELKFPEEA